MKKQVMMMAVLFVALGTVYGQHDHGAQGQKEKSKMDHAKHGGMKMEDGQVMTYEVAADFKKQLGEVYNASLKLTDSFIASDAASVSTNSSQVKATLGKVDMGLLKSSEAHMEWMMNLKEMNTPLDLMIESQDLQAQRAAYASFNQTLYKSLKAFGTNGDAVYYQHCPMALDNKGGFWLSDSKEIKNPYLGSNMLSCGSTKETIN